MPVRQRPGRAVETVEPVHRFGIGDDVALAAAVCGPQFFRRHAVRCDDANSRTVVAVAVGHAGQLHVGEAFAAGLYSVVCIDPIAQ